MDGFPFRLSGNAHGLCRRLGARLCVVERARNLNPHHPGWYWFPPLFDAYRKGDYRGALEFFTKGSVMSRLLARGTSRSPRSMDELGELEAAPQGRGRTLLAVRPDFATAAKNDAQSIGSRNSSRSYSTVCAKLAWRLLTCREPHLPIPGSQDLRRFNLESAITQTIRSLVVDPKRVQNRDSGIRETRLRPGWSAARKPKPAHCWRNIAITLIDRGLANKRRKLVRTPVLQR